MDKTNITDSTSVIHRRTDPCVMHIMGAYLRAVLQLMTTRDESRFDSIEVARRLDIIIKLHFIIEHSNTLQ